MQLLTSNRIFSVSVLSSLLAACTGASAQWSRQSPSDYELDAVARVSLPKAFKAMPDATTRTPDYSTYSFRKVNDTHINGMTSYAEELQVMLFAPDFPRDRFDAGLTDGQLGGLWKTPGLGQADANGLHWVVQEMTYEQHPVTEPSWHIRVDNKERGIVVTWRGFKKQYTLEEAKRNLGAFVEHTSINNSSLVADMATRRSWSSSGWEDAYTTNLRVAKAVLAEKQLTLVKTDSLASKGLWRLFVDGERPQQLHVIHELKALTLPDGPFRLIAPVTYYKWMQNRWYQDNQGQESDKLPRKGEAAIAWNFSDHEKIYFFQMKAVDLWKAYPSEAAFADMLRALLRKMEADHTRLLRDGFIASDAEP